MGKQKGYVKVGLGVIIPNAQGKVLIGKRIGSIAPFYSIPGGHIDPGETFEDAAVREIEEETGLAICNPRVIAVTNNLETFRNEGKHYLSVILTCDPADTEPQLLEPNKCEGWLWCDPSELPEPHFDASKRGIDCYVKNVFYKKYE